MEKKRSANDDNPVRLDKKMKAMHLKIDNIRTKYSLASSQNEELIVNIDKFRNEIKLYKEIQGMLFKMKTNVYGSLLWNSDSIKEEWCITESKTKEGDICLAIES